MNSNIAYILVTAAPSIDPCLYSIIRGSTSLRLCLLLWSAPKNKYAFATSSYLSFSSSCIYFCIDILSIITLNMSFSINVLFPIILAPLTWASPAQNLVHPNSRVSPINSPLVTSCDLPSDPVLVWSSCYNAWEKMFDDIPEGTEQRLHFLGRHVRPTGPAGTM